MTSGVWTEPSFESLARLLARRTGLAFAPNRCADLEAGTRRAMGRAGVKTVADYVQLLEAENASLDDLVAELTVGETYFLREPRHFDFIRTEVIPALQAIREPGHALRVWSAGCASGEEAYSLAILLEEAGLAGRTHILATDISRPALAAARRAVYGPWSLRGLDATFVDRHFHRAGDRHKLDERLHRAVRFEYLNLAMDNYPSLASGVWGMDLILCRNVLIYFDAATIRTVASRLMDALAEGGWLITGPSDPPLNVCAGCETVVTPAGVFYRRGAGAPRVAAAGFEAGLSLPPVVAAERPPLPELPRDTRTDPVEAAREALAAGDYARALEWTRAHPTNAAASALHVRALVNLAGPAEAARAAGEAVSRHPLSPELHLLQAVLLIDLGRHDEAAESLRRMLYLDRSLAMGHVLLGPVLRRRGDLAGARRAYRNALSLCSARSPDEVIPLSDGERAGRLAQAARVELELLEDGA